MPYRGRVQQGSELPLSVLTTDGDGEASWPDEAPVAVVYAATGRVTTIKLPPIDRGGQAGLFAAKLFLGALFTAGLYSVVYRWAEGSHRGAAVDTFEVVEGGDAGGSSLAMHHYDRPQARFLVRQTDAGRLVMGRNPRL